MKLFVGLLTILLSICSYGSTGETRTFTYDESQSNFQFFMKGTKTHTEYRTEPRHTICHRTETRYRTQCTGTGQNQTCQQVPYTVTVSYGCIQYVQVAYEVFDYDVDANVTIDVSKIASSLEAREKFTVTLHGDHLSVNVKGTKRFLAVSKENIATHMAGSRVKMIDAKYRVELIEASPIVKSLKMSNLVYKDKKLHMSLGPVEVRDRIGFHFNVTKKIFFGSNPILFDREIGPSEIMINSQATGSEAFIDLAALGVNLEKGKYSLTTKAFIKVDGEIINARDFEAIEISRTLILTQ